MQSDGQYLEALRTYYARHRALPSYARIGRLVGLSSKASVSQMVGRLKAEHFLDSAPDRRLTPGRRFFERPFVETPVRAGVPNSGDDPEVGSLDVNDYLIRKPAATFLVPVKGDSMIDAGIRDGDIVVVEKSRSANDGQIVVASVGGEVTVKRLRFERGRPVLWPENRNHSAIHPADEFSILGVVVGLARRYA